MKTKLLFPIGVALMMIVLFTSCGKDKTDRYSFWKGDIENHYYILDINEQKLHLVKGKPFMVLEHDPISGRPLRCTFGLSEAKNVYLNGVELPIPEPFIYVGDLEYEKRLGLSGLVSPIVNWREVTTHNELSAGGFQFSVDLGADFNGHEILHFRFGFDIMDGEIINDVATWGGRVSDLKAFKLIRKFNSNTVN